MGENVVSLQSLQLYHMYLSYTYLCSVLYINVKAS